MIPKNNLDDRTFDDIVAEAIRLIPRYCPEWTNHNTADPGITLIELFAWMTEMTLYRLNKVPEKIYLSLLELMGLSLVAPQSARAIITFEPVEGYHKNILIKSGTQIAAAAGDSDSLFFETEKDLYVNDNKLLSCVNRCGELWSEFCIDSKIQEFELFDSRNAVEHMLYIASPVFAYLESEHHVQISFKSVHEISSVSDELVNHLYWEYWDGRAWVDLPSAASVNGARRQDNTIYLSGPVPIQPCTVQDQERIWVRAVLSDVPSKKSTLSVKGITLKTIFGGMGFMPDSCLKNNAGQYLPVDMNGSFEMFSSLPTYNEIFYIAADEVLKNTGTRVKLSFEFSETYVRGEENENADFVYEYWDGNDWRKLVDSAVEFTDGTFGFKQPGTVSFLIPQTIAAVAVNNDVHYWIRIRLSTHDFSIGGEYIRDENNNWLWVFSSKVHSPIISKIRISYEAKKQPPADVFAESNFSWMHYPELCESSSLIKNGKNAKKLDEEKQIHETMLFLISGETSPSLYLGFNRELPPGDNSIYFKIEETLQTKPKAARLSFFNNIQENKVLESRLIDILWEFWNGDSWECLSVTDGTDMFHESGFVDFITPEKMSENELFGKKLYWFRITQLSGSFESRPKIQSILLNAVYARNETTYRNEILGTGTGAPGQIYTLAHPHLLPGSVLYVNEGTIPSYNELELMKRDGIAEPYYEDGDAVWVRYKEVNDFYSSDSFSRHYVVNYLTDTVMFGDGQRGVVPPKIKFNILMTNYRTGGGAIGNVSPHTLRVPTQNIPFIADCTNPFPAEGGADMENVDSLKARAAGVFKSLQRAVTAEDFQWLAQESSASVGRAYCLKEKNRRGEICTVVVPVIPPGFTFAQKLVPSRELLRRVTSYLNERKLVGTPIRVQAPLYRTFDIILSLIFKSDVLDTEKLKKNIEKSLRTYFHPLVGNTGSGWEFGKDVTNGSVLKQLEKIDGILSVDYVDLYDQDANVTAEKIAIKDDELPFLDNVKIENRRG